MMCNVTININVSGAPQREHLKLKISNIRKRSYPMSTGTNTPVLFQISDDQQFDVTVEAEDTAGNPTTKGFDGSTVSFAVSDPTILTLQAVDGNPLANTVVPVGALGKAQVSVKATLNGTESTGTLDVEVVAGNAATLRILPTNTRVK